MSYFLRLCMTVTFGVFLWRSIEHAIYKDVRHAAAMHHNLLTPAGPFLSIWWLIDTMLAVFLVKEWFWPTNLVPRMHVLYLLFIASAVTSTLWMESFVVGYDRVSFVPIFANWLLLFGAYLFVEDNIQPRLVTSILASTTATHLLASPSSVDFWCIRVPFTLYWAWICAASTIALNILLEAWGVHDIWIYIFWIALWIFANSVILVGVGDFVFAFVALWTLIGIACKNHHEKTFYSSSDIARYGEHYAIEVMATVGAIVFASLFVFLVVHKWWRGPPFGRLVVVAVAPSGSSSSTYGSL